MATSNKTRAWRPTDEFYATVRERFNRPGSDTVMVNLIAEEWIVMQSASPKVHQSESTDVEEMLKDIKNTLDALPGLVKDEFI